MFCFFLRDYHLLRFQDRNDRNRKGYTKKNDVLYNQQRPAKKIRNKSAKRADMHVTKKFIRVLLVVIGRVQFKFLQSKFLQLQYKCWNSVELDVLWFSQIIDAYVRGRGVFFWISTVSFHIIHAIQPMSSITCIQPPSSASGLQLMDGSCYWKETRTAFVLTSILTCG